MYYNVLKLYSTQFRCCMRAFSSCEWGLLFIVVLGLLIAAASVVPMNGL